VVVVSQTTMPVCSTGSDVRETNDGRRAWRYGEGAMSIDIDTSLPGVVFSRFDGEQTLADLERYIAHYNEVHKAGKPYIGINWMKRYTRDRELARRMGQWMKDTDAITRELVRGAAIITASTTFRFLLSSVFLVKPMNCPYTVCASLDEADRFLRPVAARCRLTLPPVLRSPWRDCV